MLRKFLQILKGSVETPDFDGSYFDYLLAEARPHADRRLDGCPEHDPLLVLIVEVLRQTHLEPWPELGDGPLVDAHSPVLGADAPDATLGEQGPAAAESPTAPDAHDEDAGGLETGDDDILSPDENPDAQEETPGEGSTPLDEAASEPEAEAEDPSPGAAISSAPPDQADLLGEDIDLDTVEAPVALDDSSRSSDSKFLQAGRIFLGLLIENDRLPVQMQLTPAEVMLSRDLLLGYFIQDEHFEPKAQELLELVEQKFNEALFSQARIMLRLFQTDRATRINNDRNLFYEEMILRMGIRRRNKVRPALLEQLDARVAEAGATAETSRGAGSEHAQLDTALQAATEWLDETLHVKFHLFTRAPERVAEWREFARKSARPGADDVFLRFVPPRRWRPVSTGAKPPSERLRAHVSAATVKQYIVRQFKTAYFVLRAVGDTGLEPFLDVFFGWTQRNFDLNAVKIMPLIYRQTMADAHLIDQIFELFFDRFFKKRAAEYLRGFDEAQIFEAAQATLDALSGFDYNKIPPGDYDLGGLILDRLFGVEYHEPEFALKLHRLT